ncbi:hypothetical protein HZA40_01950 [Candidatus Peregrinibacteria bacterium]|nr:hypothetical protein [Candidatus Peregrinibacteria bacterium]
MKKSKSQKKVTTNELLKRMEEGFQFMEGEFSNVRGEMQEGFAKVDAEFGNVRGEMQTGFARVGSEFRSDMGNSFRQFMLYLDGEFREVHDRLDKMLPRAEFLEWVHKYDGSLKEIREARQNRLLFESQFVDLDDTVAKHENRIKKLEEKAKI